MEFRNLFPIWDKLTESQKIKLEQAAVRRTVKKGTLLHNGDADCQGLLLIEEGQLRAYILSEEGREVTIYRLLSRDFCLFSASCMMSGMRFDITIEAEKDGVLWMIPADVYKSVMEESAAAANFTNEVIASRFSQVMWLVEQVLWKSFDRRLAAFLAEESVLENSAELKLTHEKIALHLGTAREVVTRMLKYFQSEGMVQLSRGTVEITDLEALRRFAE
jgi:CRP/FNR family transcriptional regulator